MARYFTTGNLNAVKSFQENILFIATKRGEGMSEKNGLLEPLATKEVLVLLLAILAFIAAMIYIAGFIGGIP